LFAPLVRPEQKHKPMILHHFHHFLFVPLFATERLLAPLVRPPHFLFAPNNCSRTLHIILTLHVFFAFYSYAIVIKDFHD
jgi:hypothetical protein